MRAADRAAVAAGTPVDVLMERAGAGAVRAIEKHFGRQYGFRVRVACGKGNNGGDGFVVARLLAACGARVEVLLFADAGSLTGAAQANWERLAGDGTGAGAGTGAGVGTGAWTGPGSRVVRRDLGSGTDADGSRARALADRGLASAEPRVDLVVDALLGTGATGPLSPGMTHAVAAIRSLAASGVRVVALDLPTGFEADTGRPTAPGACVHADLTVTFAHIKPLHVLYPEREACGAIEVVEIGVEPASRAAPGALPLPLELATEAAMAALLPRRKASAHKGDCGRVLVVGGSAGLTGAIVLASTAALRAGAGLVTAAVPESVNDAIESAMIEPMTWPLPESPERALGVAGSPMVLARAAQVSAVALGPGLSRAAEAAELARRVIAECPAPVVLDADGLNAFSGQAGLFARRHGGPAGHEPARGSSGVPAPLVVTPHLGELSRLSGRSTDELEADRLAAPRALAREWNAVVVMKGAPTVTASPDGRATVNSTGNPGMATAGMGDVLTGLIAGLVAQGLDAYDAARLGVYVHGLAADLAHARVGTLALVAGDVTAALPQAMHRLETAGTRSNPIPLPFTRMALAPPEALRST